MSIVAAINWHKVACNVPHATAPGCLVIMQLWQVSAVASILKTSWLAYWLLRLISAASAKVWQLPDSGCLALVQRRARLLAAQRLL
ncbi:unnamed protein product [Ceratitis capitata]|uniref:(Mediterranean fruit fly) hypothetical protein n=1 Tax=Ceratitis capitata TaxID=7213 RepID=A0A811V736_CERCA|nr:unnamed protein product [Ceratitis capitata]